MSQQTTIVINPELLSLYNLHSLYNLCIKSQNFKFSNIKIPIEMQNKSKSHI